MVVGKCDEGRIIVMAHERGLKPMLRHPDGLWGPPKVSGKDLDDFTLIEGEEAEALFQEAFANRPREERLEGWACLTHWRGERSAVSPDGITELFWKPSFGITGFFHDEARMPPAVARWLFSLPE